MYEDLWPRNGDLRNTRTPKVDGNVTICRIKDKCEEASPVFSSEKKKI
jgi:hypothetical protein